MPVAWYINRIFRNLTFMFGARLRIIGFFLLAITSGYAQQSMLPENPVAFGDSLKSILSATNNERAIGAGNEIAAAWLSLSADQQSLAAEQIKSLFNKRIPVKPYLVNYSASLAAAISTANLDEQRITAYLETLGQLIEREERGNLNTFLRTSELLFREQKLFSANSNTLYALDADYTFEYVMIPEFSEQEYTETEEVEEQSDEEYFDEWEEEPSDDDWDTDWEDDGWEDDGWEDDGWEEDENWEEDSGDAAMAEAIAMGDPMPIIEGAIIRLENVTFNIASPYDQGNQRSSESV